MYPIRLLLILTVFTFSNVYETNTIRPIDNVSSEMLKISTSENQFSILTLNTWALPFELKGHDHDLRFPKLTEGINTKDADIVCLQEIFNRSLRRRIEKEINNGYEYGIDLSCNRKALSLLNLDCFGGLITLSKYPIIDEKFIPFPKTKHRNLIEKIGNKGFLITSLLLPNNSKIAIINTHLRSGIDIKAQKDRMEQILFINNYIESKLKDKYSEIVLTGDLNMNHPSVREINEKIVQVDNYNFITEKMEFKNPDVKNPFDSATIGKGDNKYSSSKDGVQILDYCMYKNMTKNKSIDLVSQNTCFNGNNSISDHKGIVSIFEMKVI